MVALRGPSYAEQVIIDVVTQMMKEDRKPSILAMTQRHGVRQINDADVLKAVQKLIMATDEDEGVTLSPWETLMLLGYITKLELVHRGEFYGRS